MSKARKSNKPEQLPSACIVCAGAMYEVLGSRKMVTGKSEKFRKRRFMCEDCGNTETIFADGQNDTVAVERSARSLDEDFANERFNPHF